MVDVCVLGLGHIGLPTAVTLAGHGQRVIGVDTNPELVATVNRGECSSTEPGLAAALSSVVAAGLLTASLTPADATAFIICVPTPLGPDRRPDLSAVDAAARAVGERLRPGNLVVLESTVPPGTTANGVAGILERASGLKAGSDFALAHCPERVLPGNILREIEGNDRVIGGVNEASTGRARELYSSFVKGEMYETDATTAEIAKLAENIYRDVNIALANELAAVMEELGGDVWEVIALANRHPRVNLHWPGPGVGGYCIPIASLHLLSALGHAGPVIEGAREVNDAQPARVARAALAAVQGVDTPRIAVLGAAYKGGVGDARSTPAAEVVEALMRAGAQVAVHDDRATAFSFPLHPLHEALAGADVLLLITDHSEFREMDPEAAARLMRGRVVFDARNCLARNRWEQAGFTFHRLGVGGTGKRSV